MNAYAYKQIHRVVFIPVRSIICRSVQVERHTSVISTIVMQAFMSVYSHLHAVQGAHPTKNRNDRLADSACMNRGRGGRPSECLYPRVTNSQSLSKVVIHWRACIAPFTGCGPLPAPISKDRLDNVHVRTCAMFCQRFTLMSNVFHIIGGARKWWVH